MDPNHVPTRSKSVPQWKVELGGGGGSVEECLFLILRLFVKILQNRSKSLKFM